MCDDDQPLTFRWALRASEFWLFVVASVASRAGVSAWLVVPLVLAALSIVGLPKYIALWPRARDAGAARVWWQTVALSQLNNFAVAMACVLLGRIVRWLWM